ncbi:MAG: nucleotidyltransferase family protein [Acidobacteria bacterium]|nr:nucleotidyltransferase family protein [Acidobacteriota bacterium]
MASCEFEILRCCASLQPAKSEEVLEHLLKQPPDWVHLLRLAACHTLTPLLLHSLRESGTERLVPEEILLTLHNHVQENTCRNLYSCSELSKLLVAFARFPIDVMTFKGPTFAQQFYGSLSLRRFGDLDLLIRRNDVWKARDLLMAEGFTPEVPAASRPEQYWLLRQGQYICDRNRDDLRVELHWEFAPKYFSVLLNDDLLWSRRRYTHLGGMPTPVPSHEDLLLILCCHGAKHLWSRLSWIADVKCLIRSTKSLDWDYLMRRARETGTLRMLYTGLLVAGNLLACVLPQAIDKCVRKDASACELALDVLKHLETSGSPIPRTRETVPFHVRSRERWKDKLTYLVRFAFDPTWSDLPSIVACWPLTYLARPIRIALKSAFSPNSPERDLARYYPTPAEIVLRELQMAEITPDDVVYDLGCGDGRVVIAAATLFGARGVGIDVDPVRIAEARGNARKAGVQARTRFIQKRIQDVDFSEATVVTFYFPWPSNLAIRSHLLSLRSGTRIVSCDSDLPGMPPQRVQMVKDQDGMLHRLYLWKIEAGKSPPCQDRQRR